MVRPLVDFDVDTTPSRADMTPKRRSISSVTQAQKAVVTTTEDHGYDSVSVVRLYVYAPNTMVIHGVETDISVLTPTTFETKIDTRHLEPFSAPSFPTRFTPSYCIPVTGEFTNSAPPLS